MAKIAPTLCPSWIAAAMAQLKGTGVVIGMKPGIRGDGVGEQVKVGEVHHESEADHEA